MPISHIDEEREGILIYADGIEEGLVCIYDPRFVLIILFYRVVLYYTIAFGYIRYHHLMEDGVCADELIDQITNDILHEKLGLLNIEEYYRVKHAERMEWDRTYNSQLEFVFI